MHCSLSFHSFAVNVYQHKKRKIGSIRKKNRQPISELLERKIGNFWSRLGSCLAQIQKIALAALACVVWFPDPSHADLYIRGRVWEPDYSLHGASPTENEPHPHSVYL